MGMIMIDTDCSAPGCVCQIRGGNGMRKTILIQPDWDYPGTASSFGWSTMNVQRCKECGKCLRILAPDDAPHSFPMYFACENCEALVQPCCEHRNTDGTVDCKLCGVTATDFINSAGEYLSNNDGKEADDPGYFD